MIEFGILEGAISLVVGAAVGAFYFAVLWITVRRLVRAGRSFLVLAASFVLRNCLAVAALYFIMNHNWLRLIAALIGFVIARELAVRSSLIEKIKAPRSTVLWK